ncbi:MAG TPA: carboxylesterase family protein, partial [Novosphingobium sp.]|nr:carboxylesterase family protein [Novosphingobium sp.]
MQVARRTFLASSLAAGLATRASALDPANPVVETRHGKVRGEMRDGVHAFRGIPYGAPTGGASRFLPPPPPGPRAGGKGCLARGPMAPPGPAAPHPPAGMGADMARFFGTAPGAQTEPDEDCLRLNVFTTALSDGGKRPVMVWLHGGGFSIGTGAGPRTEGINLARRQGVVCVSLNHRLGAMGYAWLGGLHADYAESGNQGQRDLILALEWVRDNIEAFGGDPGRVMIHGESGGGGKVGTLLGMPRAAGLFHRAGLQSGTPGRLPTTEDAHETTLELLRELDIAPADFRRLRDEPWQQIVAAQGRMEFRSRTMPGSRRGFVPSVGAADLPVQPNAAVAAGSARLPVMIGCNRHEANLFLAGSGVMPDKVDEAMLTQRFAGMFGPRAGEALAGYRAIHPDASPGDLLVRAMSDSTRMGGIDLAEAHVRGGGAPTFQYLFTWESPVTPVLKSAHGIDAAFYFDTTEALPITRGNAEAAALAARASAAWAAFAHGGDPST